MIDVETIPLALRQCDQWVAWRLEPRHGRDTKVPYDVKTGGMASSTDPDTWAPFDEAVQAEGYTGVGFVFTKDDPYFGVDLDDCVDGAGQIDEGAKALVDTFATYTEMSPSGTGLKLFGVGSKPSDERCRTKNTEWGGEIELYDFGRFFTVTGLRLHDSPVEVNDVEDVLASVYNSLFPSKPSPRSQAVETVSDLADDELVKLASASKNGAKFRDLWQGGTSAYGGDDSAADMALCCVLAFWCQRNHERVDALFRQSGLMRDKWDEMRGATTYGERTVAKACDGCAEVYDPARGNTEWPEPKACELSASIESVIAGKRRSVPWPYTAVHKLSRALVAGTITLFCGSPGASKTFMMLECAAWWHEQGHVVSVLMLEDTKEYHLHRVLAQRSRNGSMTRDEWIEQNPERARSIYQTHSAFVESFAKRLSVPPTGLIPGIEMVVRWAREQAEGGARVIVIDPITMAGTGNKAWVEDAELSKQLKKVAEEHMVSLVLVTHPKKGSTGHTLDDLAGGASMPRFSQTVLWLEFLEDDTQKSCRRLNEGIPSLRDCNRVLHVVKARNGPGQNKKIGMVFCKKSLTFVEQGVIVKQKKGVWT